MAEQLVDVTPVGGRDMSYPFRAWWWGFRRRRLARHMERRGAAVYEVLLELRADARRNPPPR